MRKNTRLRRVMEIKLFTWDCPNLNVTYNIVKYGSKLPLPPLDHMGVKQASMGFGRLLLLLLLYVYLIRGFFFWN